MAEEQTENQNFGNESYISEGKHLLKKKRRERIVRKGRLKQERLRILVRFLISVLCIAGIFYGSKCSGWYMPKSAFYKADSGRVEIINNNIVSDGRIYALLKNSNFPTVPIFMAKTNFIKQELMKLSPVENVYIRRYAFPARIQIIVRERIPAIRISPDEKVPPVAVFTTDGKLIGKEFLPLKNNSDTILVLSYGNKGDDYHKWDLNRIREIQKIAEYVSIYSKEPVEYIDFRNPEDVYVKVKSVNIRLGKIDNTVFKRIERIPSILPQVKLVETKVKYLDLSWEKVNYLKLK